MDTHRTCPECKMSYRPHLPADNHVHTKHHERAVNGRDWLESWGTEITTLTLSRATGSSQLVRVVELNPLKPHEVKVGEELLHLANTELNAPSDSGFWKPQNGRGPAGKIYVCVSKGKVIGFVSVVTRFESPTAGRWMLLQSGQVIPSQQFPIMAGVSRIFVMNKFRRQRLAIQMLQVIQTHALYGSLLKKHQLAFSQPSSSGGQLAKTFNGVLHKSGEWLVPVYIEE